MSAILGLFVLAWTTRWWSIWRALAVAGAAAALGLGLAAPSTGSGLVRAGLALDASGAILVAAPLLKGTRQLLLLSNLLWRRPEEVGNFTGMALSREDADGKRWIRFTRPEEILEELKRDRWTAGLGVALLVAGFALQIAGQMVQ